MLSYVKNRFNKKWMWWSTAGIIAMTLLLIICGIIYKNSAAAKTSVSSSRDEVNKNENIQVTYENFTKIQLGSKYEDAVALIGEGKETESYEKDGIRTSAYTWKGKDVSNISIWTENGVITSKEQTGLDTNDSKITLNKYNQVKEGMTYSEVVKIAGEGQIKSQSKITEMETVVFMYCWPNKDGSKMTATFTGGKLSAKSQFQLK